MTGAGDGPAGPVTGRMVEAHAPAKINLTLKITGRRADGYHLLDSWVVFASVGDRLRFSRRTLVPGTAEATARMQPELRVTGPQAAGLAGTRAEDNLLVRAARLLLQAGVCVPACIELEKHLPVASGIGGASADAAALLRAYPVRDRAQLAALALRIGADVPVCLDRIAARMRGIGERIDPMPQLPVMDAVLVHPGFGLATRAVFQEWSRMAAQTAPDPCEGDSCPDPPEGPGPWSLVDTVRMLAARGNDLLPAALALAPELETLLATLRSGPGVVYASMSGSGATCFALCASQADAAHAAAWIGARAPGWWVTACRLGQVPAVQEA